MNRNKRSPRLTFPKTRPEYTVAKYINSKRFEEMPKLHPEFDVVRDNHPKTKLALLQTSLRATEHLLHQRRRSMFNIRIELNRQWRELNDKEKSLRESFIYFNQFIRENAEKKSRAEKKIVEDRILGNKRAVEIKDLMANFQEMKQFKNLMDQKIKEYRLYDDYLSRVAEESEEFTSIQDMLNRYMSLVDAKNHLAALQESNLSALENARSEMMKLVEEKNFIIMGLNNQIANLQARYENANVKSLECEQLVVQIKNSAVKQMNEIDEVKCSLWNVYVHMAQSKKHPIKIKKEAVEEQMMYIKRTLTELAKVNQILKKKSRAAAKAKEIAAKAAASNPY